MDLVLVADLRDRLAFHKVELERPPEGLDR